MGRYGGWIFVVAAGLVADATAAEAPDAAAVEDAADAADVEDAPTPVDASAEVLQVVPPPTDVPSRIPTELPGPRIPLGDVGFFEPFLNAQLRFEADFPLDDGEATASWSLPRLRTGADVRLLNEALHFKVQLSLAPGKLELVDWYVEARAHARARVRVGAFTIPFTRYRQQSSTTLPMVDWALTTEWFGGERQLGAMVHGGTGEPGVQYALGVFTGRNQRASHAVALQELYGLDRPSPSSLVDPHLPQEIAPEVVGMVGWGNVGPGKPRGVDRNGGPLRWVALVSGAVDARPVPAVDLAARLAPEVELRYRRVTVRGIAYLGWVVPAGGSDGWTLGAAGGLAEVTWSAHRFLDVAARWAGTWWMPELADAAGLDPGSAQEVGVGLGVPVIGDQVEWANDLRWVGDTRTGDAFVLRSQIQVAF